MSKKNADPQALRVYKWEYEWAHWNNKAYDDLKVPRRWMRWAAKQAQISYKKIRTTHRPFSFFRPLDDTIYLTRDHMNAPTVLHETAHAIIDEKYEPRRSLPPEHPKYIQTHGPEWLGVYMILLNRAGFVPMEALKASLDKRKLKYNLRFAGQALSLKRKRPSAVKH